MPYVSNPPYNKFQTLLKCSKCNKDLPTFKNGFLPNQKKELDWETDIYISVDLVITCHDHPTAPFYIIYKTELRGEKLDNAYQD